MSLTVLHLVGAFPVLYEHAMLAEIDALVRQGVTPRIVAFHPAAAPLPTPFPELDRRVKYLDVGRPRSRFARGIKSLAAGLGCLAAAPRLARACLKPSATMSWPSAFWRRARLGRLLTASPPDVVHAQFGHLGLFALPVVRRLGIPLVVGFRGQDVMLVSRASAAARAVLFEHARRVFVRSRDMQGEIVRIGCPADKAAVQPSGIDVQALPFKERTPPGADERAIVLMSGRIVPKKGMADGLRAIAQCGFNPIVRIVGHGPQLPDLRELTGELGLGDSITFLGALSHHDVIREMLNAHVFLCPSRTAPDGEKEGVPNTLKEAQATGLPVVATRHAGIPECVEHNRTGLLSPEGDVEALARNLHTLLAGPQRRPDMGRRGRALMEAHYDLRVLAPQLVRHYEDVARQEKAPR